MEEARGGVVSQEGGEADEEGSRGEKNRRAAKIRGGISAVEQEKQVG